MLAQVRGGLRLQQEPRLPPINGGGLTADADASSPRLASPWMSTGHRAHSCGPTAHRCAAHAVDRAAPLCVSHTLACRGAEAPQLWLGVQAPPAALTSRTALPPAPCGGVRRKGGAVPPWGTAAALTGRSSRVRTRTHVRAREAGALPAPLDDLSSRVRARESPRSPLMQGPLTSGQSLQPLAHHGAQPVTSGHVRDLHICMREWTFTTLSHEEESLSLPRSLALMDFTKDLG